MAEKEEKKDKGKKAPGLNFLSAGAVLALAAFFMQSFSTAFGLVREDWIWSAFYIGAAGLALVGIMGLFSRHRKLLRFFEAAGLEAGGRKPTVLNVKKTEGGVIYTVSMPCGMAMSDFEKKKEALEQWLRRKVTISFDGNLIIETVKPGKTLYPYDERGKWLFPE